jgi:hypothetical protein
MTIAGTSEPQVVNGPVGTAGSAQLTQHLPVLASKVSGCGFGALHASAAAFSLSGLQTRGAGGAVWPTRSPHKHHAEWASCAVLPFSLSGGLFSISDVNDVGAVSQSTVRPWRLIA